MTCDRQAKSCLACVCSNVASTSSSSSSSTGDQHDRLCHASAADQDADIGMPITSTSPIVLDTASGAT
jgi:hypothetical protein